MFFFSTGLYLEKNNGIIVIAETNDAIKEKIEQGDFRFDSSDDKYCGYCEIGFMCNKSLLDKGKIDG